ncbi:MAG: prephenate dehydrogenase/arogenate dehydrogenase family protein, partial [Deltaproteobacteria bacterium]|nr:prephenate dehydrogenase/arogenate dehydrogenase family protein [Deltaproteobacteria bacterium]
MLGMAGSSFRDMTRVAASPPEMWRDICVANQTELLRVIRRFETELGKFKQAVEKGLESNLYQLFEQGNKLRRKYEENV